MTQGIRVSCNKIAPVGKVPKADWTQQSHRFISPKTGRMKQPRRGWRKDQVVLTDGLPLVGQTINMIEPVRVKNSNGQMIEVLRGKHKGKTVQRSGYAYAHTQNGKTPGRWLYV